MKYLFVFILLIHGIIHFMGFVKAFKLHEVSQLTLSISKTTGVFWFFTGLLFVIAFVALLLKQQWWPVLGMIAIVLSQILIIYYWKDAKYGTIVNLIVFLVAISSYATYRFNGMVQKEIEVLSRTDNIKNLPHITNEDIAHLPEIVRKWILNSGFVGRERIVYVSIGQEGQMRTKPNSKWMPFTATQHFRVDQSAFIWQANVKAMPLVHLLGRDKLIHGEGEMLIKLLGFFTVVDERNHPKVNSASMLRYLAETSWFPTAALNENIIWEEIAPNTAKATLTINDKSVTGIFTFTDKGEMVSFECERYYGTGKDARLEKWFIEALGHKTFDGIKIPHKSRVVWRLDQGDFDWLHLEITHLDYNTLP